MVYSQEIHFLNFSTALLLPGIGGMGMERHEHDPEFKGLGREGQNYLKMLLSKRAMAFLLENGAAVPGTAVSDQKRISHYTFFTRPAPFIFSKDLYRVILHLFNNDNLLPGVPYFTPADQIILTLILENHFDSPRDFINRDDAGFILSHSLTGRICFLDKATDLQIEPERLVTACHNRDTCNHYFYCLRFLIRNNLLRQFRAILETDAVQEAETYGETLQMLLHHLFDHLLKQNRMEAFEPFCQTIDHLFEDTGPDLIEEKLISPQALAHTADKIRARKKLIPMFEWIGQIISIQNQAIQTRAWDENFESMNIFKRSYGLIRESSLNRAQQTLDYLENIV